MKSKINLYFKTIHNETLGKGKIFEIIRLEGLVCFKTLEGWTKPFRAIVDTGAPVTLIPLSIWKQILCKSIKKGSLQGIVSREGCAMPVIIGKVFSQLCDEEGGFSKEAEILAYLALSDESPLIIGFKDLLDNFKVYFNYKNKRAYLGK